MTRAVVQAVPAGEVNYGHCYTTVDGLSAGEPIRLSSGSSTIYSRPAWDLNNHLSGAGRVALDALQCGALNVRPQAGSVGAARGPAARPPAGAPARPVAVTPRPVDRPVVPRGEAQHASPGVSAPPRNVSPPRAAEPAPTPARPPSGERQVERQRSSSPSSLVTPHAAAAQPAPSRERLESPRPSMRAFPGESANGPAPRGAEMRRHRESRAAAGLQSEQSPTQPRERHQR